MWNQNCSRIVRVIQNGKSRIRPRAVLTQLFNHRIIFTQRQQNINVGRLRLWRDGNFRSRIRDFQIAVIRLPRLQINGAGYRPIVRHFRRRMTTKYLFPPNPTRKPASAKADWILPRYKSGRHTTPWPFPAIFEKDIFLLRSKPATSQNPDRPARAGERNRLQIKFFAFGFPFVLELIPSVPTAPVFLGVKQRNQSGETRDAK